MKQTETVFKNNHPVWDTDLVWEISEQEYKQLKNNRATVKIECFNVVPNGRKMKRMGYFVEALKLIRINDPLFQWVKLLQPSANCRPELKVRMRVMRYDEYYREVEQKMQEEQTELHVKGNVEEEPKEGENVKEELDEEEKTVIEVGSEGGEGMKISITIDSVKGLKTVDNSFYMFFQVMIISAVTSFFDFLDLAV